MNWLYYLLEANFYLGIFYLLYYFMLRKETYYQFNRAYLLTVCVIAFIIPLLQVGILKKPVPLSSQMAVTAVLINNPAVQHVTQAPVTVWAAGDYYLAIYSIVAIIMAILFTTKIFRLFRLMQKGKRVTNNAFYMVEIDHTDAFSFLNHLFINPKLADIPAIIQHEMVHIRQKHSLDILFLEFFKIINWFNPVVYLLENNVKDLHEFIADHEIVSQQGDISFYADFLLHNAYDLSGSGSALTNNFFNKNLLKRRIMMLYQKPSGNRARLRYLLILPVCAGLLCFSTLGFSKTYGWVDLLPPHNLPATKLATPDIAAIAVKIPMSDTEKVNHHKEKYIDGNDHITPKGYHYRETTLVHNGRVDFAVNIFPNEKNVDALKILKSRATAKIIKMLEDKFGYTFPSKIPPPPPPLPPVPPAAKVPHGPNAPRVKRFPPPVVVPVDTGASAAATRRQAAPPPPMAPFMPPANGFSVLDKYMGRHTRFPKVAMDKKLTGSVIESFTIGSDKKISNVAFIKGIGGGCDEEVTRALKSFDGTINAKPGTYKLAVTFAGHGLEAPKPASESLGNDPSFAGEVVVEYYPINKN
jgi:hypothetical protein